MEGKGRRLQRKSCTVVLSMWRSTPMEGPQWCISTRMRSVPSPATRCSNWPMSSSSNCRHTHTPWMCNNQFPPHCSREVFHEPTEGVPAHVMGIVHGAVKYMPELVQYLATHHPDLAVKAGHLRKSEVQSLRMDEYCERVASSYCCGTFRTGPLQQVSLVGQVAEESGGYLSDVLGKLCCQYPLVSPLTSPGPQIFWSRAPSCPFLCRGALCQP